MDNQSAPQTTENQQAAPQVEAQQTEAKVDGWDDKTYEQVSSRYKNDPKEIARAKWNQDKEMTRLQQEVAALKKGASPKDSSSAQSTQPPQSQAKSAETANASESSAASEGGKLSIHDVNNNLYLEVFENGKPSDETIAALKEQGYSDSQIALEVAAKQQVVQQRVKEAQQFVEVDVKELRKFAETPGAFTDRELAIIQGSLDLAAETGDPSYYRILKVVEARYNGAAKRTIQHGSVSTNVNAGDVYANPDDYYKDRKSSLYGWDKDFTVNVDAKYKRSNTDDWQQQLLGKTVGKR